MYNKTAEKSCFCDQLLCEIHNIWKNTRCDNVEVKSETSYMPVGLNNGCK